MQNYNIFVDEMETLGTDSARYQIALIPASRHGALATKNYFNKESLATDLNRYLRYTEDAIQRFFSMNDRHATLVQYALSDEDAAALSWLPNFDR